MCPGESAGRSDGQGGPNDLVPAILARIAGGDLPAGSELDPERLALLFESAGSDVEEALARLESLGATERVGRHWRVSRSRDGQARDLMHWIVPLLRAVVSLAVARTKPGEAAGILAAYDRFAGLAGDSSPGARAQGYRLLMERLAAASGSNFHVRTMAGLLGQAEPLIDRIVAHNMASRRTAEPDDELGRLAQAIMQGNPAAAEAALEDHLIILGHHLDRLAPTRP
jgi:DNA-binding GntR family transcriptional regulator